LHHASGHNHLFDIDYSPTLFDLISGGYVLRIAKGLAVQGPAQVASRVNEPDMAVCLREVSEELPGVRVYHLGKQANVIYMR
jgi:hypothetical protein